MIDWLRYLIARWWLKRQIALCHYRREELHAIVRRELAMLDHEEGVANARLRELQSRRLSARLGRVAA